MVAEQRDKRIGRVWPAAAGGDETSKAAPGVTVGVVRSHLPKKEGPPVTKKEELLEASAGRRRPTGAHRHRDKRLDVAEALLKEGERRQAKRPEDSGSGADKRRLDAPFHTIVSAVSAEHRVGAKPRCDGCGTSDDPGPPSGRPVTPGL